MAKVLFEVPARLNSELARIKPLVLIGVSVGGTLLLLRLRQLNSSNESDRPLGKR